MSLDSFDIVPLVSFPKSGNTWLRFLLANLFKKDPEMVVDYSTLNRIMPTSHTDDLSESRDFMREDAPVFVKHHYRYGDMPYRHFARAIYISRNGFDALYSYWHFLNAQSPGLYPNLDVFSRCYWKYCGHWGDHISSWVDSCLPKEILHIRYEELLNDTSGVLLKCCEFLGHEPREGDLERAVLLSSKDKMKSLSNSAAFMKSKASDFNFVRSAKSGDGESKLSESCKEQFLSYRNNFKMMVEEGYLDSSSPYSSLAKRERTPLADILYCHSRRVVYRAKSII